MQAIEKAGYTGKIQIGMDVAASEFCKEGFKYDLDFKNPNSDPKDWVTICLYQIKSNQRYHIQCSLIQYDDTDACVFFLQLSSDQLLEVYKGFAANYPVVSIEDSFDQDDWDAWGKMNAAMSVQLVG